MALEIAFCGGEVGNSLSCEEKRDLSTLKNRAGVFTLPRGAPAKISGISGGGDILFADPIVNVDEGCIGPSSKFTSGPIRANLLTVRAHRRDIHLVQYNGVYPRGIFFYIT